MSAAPDWSKQSRIPYRRASLAWGGDDEAEREQLVTLLREVAQDVEPSDTADSGLTYEECQDA
jgi:hypothetical protein